MSQPFLGEIRIVPFNFAPKGWALCNGQVLPIQTYTALFSLLGTFYGGDGKSNFALPNLQGRAPLHYGQGPGLTARSLGAYGGESTVTLLATQIPSHIHQISGNSGNGDVNTPANNVWATPHLGKTPINLYSSSAGTAPAMNALALAQAGSSLPHNNLPPYLTLTFVICMSGIFPTRS